MSQEENIPRLSRLTAILLRLQSRPYVTIKQLSEQFEVSTRTIYRDLLSLEQAGVPIMPLEGKGFTLMEGYNIPPVMFTESEANALIIAVKIIEKTKDESLILEFHKAIEKIQSVLNPDEQEKSAFLAQRTIIGKNWHNQTNSSWLTEIQQALTNRHVLLIDYQKKEEEIPTQRAVEPFAIYNNTAENWVLIAWCRLREDFRTFRIDRIKKLYTSSESFPPHKITLEEYIGIQKEKFSKDL